MTREESYALFQDIVDEVQFDAHGTIIKYCRSQTVSIILANAQQLLGHLADWLDKNWQTLQYDLAEALSLLLNDLRQELGQLDEPRIQGFPEWIAWLRQNAA